MRQATIPHTIGHHGRRQRPTAHHRRNIIGSLHLLLGAACGWRLWYRNSWQLCRLPRSPPMRTVPCPEYVMATGSTRSPTGVRSHRSYGSLFPRGTASGRQDHYRASRGAGARGRGGAALRREDVRRDPEIEFLHFNDNSEAGDICDALVLHIRKAYDLVAIADAVDNGLLARNTVQEIGWSKSRLIATQARTKRQAQNCRIGARNSGLTKRPLPRSVPLRADVSVSDSITTESSRHTPCADPVGTIREAAHTSCRQTAAAAGS